MARGDYFDIKYKAQVGEVHGVATHRVVASSVGGSVELDEPREKDPYVIVRELNKAGASVQTARFAKGEVVAIIQGHEKAAKKKFKVTSTRPMTS